MTVQQMVGAFALVQAMRQDGLTEVCVAHKAARARPMAAYRAVQDERSEKPPATTAPTSHVVLAK